MNSFILPATSYTANPQVRATKQNTISYRNTIIEDSPQEYTPRRSTFDDLYDVSEDESELDDIPIAIALSPLSPRNDSNYPTLDIPSPTAWPSIHNFQKPGVPQPFNPTLLSPHITVPSMKLNLITNRLSIHSNGSNAPSLDGSMTSEEMATISCPSTPDMANVDDNSESWTLPAQLQPSSLTTLDCLAKNRAAEDTIFALRPIEMQERGTSLSDISTEIEIAMTPIENGELSAISIPSPGGFFASLASDARNAWSMPQEAEATVPTAIAENFYDVPFGSPPTAHVRYHELQVHIDDTNVTEGPPTARQIPAHWNCGTPGLQALKSPNFTDELAEYNQNYQKQLRDMSDANIDRTASWLTSQGGCSATTSEQGDDEPQQEQEQEQEPEQFEEESTAPKDTLFFRGFQHLHTSKQTADAFVHRKTRTEKLRLDRKCLFTSHVNQLQGKFSTRTPVTAIKTEPVSEDDKEKANIQAAVREQEALQQLEPVAWNVEATKYLNGGTLLTSPTGQLFKVKKDARILDLGGLASCDWSWQVALEHPDASIHTVCTKDFPIDQNIATPKNHRQTVVPNLWTLPFPSNHFDCISARNVYSLLKLDKVAGTYADQYDLCLKECMRVLCPGGYLEFALLDADIMNSGPRGAKLGLEFTFNLKNHGYDAAPTKAWLPRLRKAGFGQIRRAWLVLPMSQHGAKREGTTADASHITGMVGSWAWERWMLKLHKEMGRDETKLLDGVVGVLEEGAKTGGSWRCLSGWARKPFDN